MAEIRAPNLDFNNGTQPNRIPVSVQVAVVATPVISPDTIIDLEIRANAFCDFTTQYNWAGVTGNTSGPLVIQHDASTTEPAPKLSALATGPTISGTGSTSSYPICG